MLSCLGENRSLKFTKRWLGEAILTEIHLVARLPPMVASICRATNSVKAINGKISARSLDISVRFYPDASGFPSASGSHSTSKITELISFD
jgi:hypothetical protein